MSNVRARLGLSLTATVAAAALLVPSGAAAATEFGDNCAANDLAPAPFGLFEVTAPFNPLPTAAPSGGVITKWKVTSGIPAPLLSRMC